MSVKTIVQQQYRSIVDNAAASIAGLKTCLLYTSDAADE